MPQQEPAATDVELSAADYLSIARNMIWLVHECCYDKQDLVGRKTVHDLNFVLAEIDRLKPVVIEHDAQLPTHNHGIPPNSAWVKLAKTILLSHRDHDGQVTVGPSTCRIMLPPATP